MFLLKRIQKTIFENRLFSQKAKIILAVSGGPDSIFLLDIFSRLASKYDLKLCLAHINYHLRGQDSQKDEKLVKELSRKYNYPLLVFNAQKLIENWQKISSNLENALRKIRYRFLEKLRKKIKFDLIAVAHTLDDQAETFLMHLFRGAGLQGLRAMQFKNQKIIRPLLEISKTEIELYLKKNKLEFRQDRSNMNLNFFRNRIRHKILPYLEKELKSNLKKVLARQAQFLVQDYDFLQKSSLMAQKKLAVQFFNNLKNSQNNFQSDKKINKIELDLKSFSLIHSALQNQILRRLIAALKGDLENISSRHLQEIQKIIISQKNKIQKTEFKNLKVIKKNDKLVLMV